MNVTYKIEKNAKKFNLVTNRVDKYTLKIHSEKYLFDSWLVEQDGDRLRLLHLSKKRCNQKCMYHLQREICSRNWIWILESVSSHNEYTITKKWNARENLVDKVLKEYRNGEYKKNV